MDQVQPLSIENGPTLEKPSSTKLPIDKSYIIENGITPTNEQSNIDAVKEPEVNGDDNTSTEQPTRGLELIYKFAEELATQIADEKRYEGIIKKCSVSVQKLPDSYKYKIVRDASLIKKPGSDDNPLPCNKAPSDEESNNNQCDEGMQVDYDSSDEEDEVILPPKDQVFERKDDPLETAIFFCIFCTQKSITGFSSAFDHYQSHLDYYPYKCAHCLEVTTNLKNLFIHYRKDHSEEKTAMFKTKLMPWVTEWIDAFLKSQLSSKRQNATVKPYCPVCESSGKKEDIIQLPPNLIQPRKQWLHIFKHLMYEPYICMICQKAGKKFTFNDFDERAFEHILKFHPECEDELLVKVLQKSRYIKPLESYILHYLTNAGVSTKKRTPEKITNSVRNKFKSRHESKERAVTIDKDNCQNETLIGLINQQPSTSLLDDQVIEPTLANNIGQITNNLSTLSNQAKGNLNSTAHSISETSPSTLRPVKMMIPSSSPMLISPSKGPPPQVASFTINNPPLFAIPQNFSSIPQNVKKISPKTVSLLNNYPSPDVIQLPCGQLMVRNVQLPSRSPPTSSTVPFPSSSLQTIPNFVSPAINSIGPTTMIVRYNSPPAAQSNQNNPVQLQVPVGIRNLVSNDMLNERKKEEDFTRRDFCCIFCKKSVTFGSYTDGIFHFSRHLNYKPVICLICNEKFGDLDEIMKHFTESHTHEKNCQDYAECAPLLYYINRDGELEKWVESFLDFQISGEFLRLTNVDLAPFCIVCKLLRQNAHIPTRASASVTLTPSVDTVRQHLNHHINYRPYECFLCAKAGTQIRYASLAETALRHLKSHGFSPHDQSFIKDFFHFKPIMGLENFVKNFLITEFYPYANSSRQLKSGSPERKAFAFNNNSSGVHPRNYTNNLPSSSNHHEPKRLFNYTNASAESLSPITPCTPNPPREQASVNSFARSTFACYHCKLAISGLRELLAHSKNFHPNLSVASYCIPSINGNT